MSLEQPVFSKPSRTWFNPWKFLFKILRKGTTPPEGKMQDEAAAAAGIAGGESGRKRLCTRREFPCMTGPKEPRTRTRSSTRSQPLLSASSGATNVSPELPHEGRGRWGAPNAASDLPRGENAPEGAPNAAFAPPSEESGHSSEEEETQQPPEGSSDVSMSSVEAREVLPSVETEGAADDAFGSAPHPTTEVPPVLQFFVKSLEGKTVVMRESKQTSVNTVKGALLEGSDEQCLDSVFLTYEGRILEEGLTLGDVGIAPGGTLQLRVRFQSTVYVQRVTRRVRLHSLVRELILGNGRRELWGGIVEEMCLVLRPSIDESTFQPLGHAQTFVSGGGVKAVASLLENNCSFLAFSCVELVSERIETLPAEDPLRFVALYVGWHLLEAIVEKSPVVQSQSNARTHCIVSLSCLARFQGYADVAVWDLLPRSEDKNQWEQLRTNFCTLWVPEKVPDMKEARDVARAMVTRLSDSGVKLFRDLPAWMEYLHDHQGPCYCDRAPYKKRVNNLFYHLSRALKTILSPTIDSALVRGLHPQGFDSMPPAVVVFGTNLEGKFQSLTIESSVSYLSAHLLDYIVVAVKALVELAEIDEKLKERSTGLFLELREGLTAVLSRRTKDFCGMEKLGPLFERPYRHLWATSLKERWLRENLPTPRVNSLKVTVQRDHNMLANAFNRIGGANPSELHQGIGVSFRDEEGYGPGVTREFLFKIAEKLFNPEFALFRTAPTDRRRVFPNANSGVNSRHLAYFRFCGRIVALAIAHKVQIGVTFCSALLDALWEANSVPLARGRMTDGHVAAKDIDPELYESCEKLLKMSEDEFNALGLTFVYSRESLGAYQECELIPGGFATEVSFDRREEFIKLKVQKQLLEPVKEQIDALQDGMESLFTQVRFDWQHVYGVLTEQEFASLLQGDASEVSVEDWKAHTTYHGYSENHVVIRRFWEAVRGLTPEQQRNLLYFATAVRYLPSTGFAGLPERFHIYSTESGVDKLPTSHTCYFQMVLPKYKSREQMTARLQLIAQGHIAESFGSL